MIRKALLIAAATWALSLTGCDIYFGPGSGSDCWAWGCDEPWPGGVAPGEACNNTNECAPGCYCDSATNTCQESGFCSDTWDCPMGFVCDPARATCIPVGGPDGCESDADCPFGNYCDAGFGVCLPSWGCSDNSDCGPGWECNAYNTCVPVSCDEDSDCFEGCACAVDSGYCVETGFCREDAECPRYCDPSGECTQLVCDTSRNTCTFPQPDPDPEPDPDPVTCGGPVTCSVAAPTCQQGEAATLVDGCYTGECIPVAECDVPPLATCDRILNANQCISRPDCEVNWTGINCTCDGVPCNCADNPTSCTCESYEYSCQPV